MNDFHISCDKAIKNSTGTVVQACILKDGTLHIKDSLVSSEDYNKYRGKCKEFSKRLVKHDLSLKLVKGFYFCPILNREEQHWWCKDKNDRIIDPTKKQFPSKGNGTYREFEGYFNCSNCNNKVYVNSKNTIIEGRHSYCNDDCYKEYVGCD